MKLLAVVLLALSTFATSVHADSSDSFNLRIEPIGMLIGRFNARLDYKINDQLVIGPSVEVWDVDLLGFEISGYGIGGQVEYFFDKAYESGWMLDGRVGFMTLKAEDTDFLGTHSEAEFSGMRARAIGGYHWFWGDVFNLALGGGLEFNTFGDIELKNSAGTVTDTEEYDAVGFALMAELGFSF